LYKCTDHLIASLVYIIFYLQNFVAIDSIMAEFDVWSEGVYNELVLRPGEKLCKERSGENVFI